MSEHGVSRNAQRLQERQNAILEALVFWVNTGGVLQEDRLRNAWAEYAAERERQGLPPVIDT